MILMRLRELKSCPEHTQTIVVLEDMTGQRKLAIAVDPGESKRLVREMRNPDARHPIFDFLDAALQACQATPTRVVLEYVAGAGLSGAVWVFGPGGEVAVPCYVSDALAFARRSTIPVYVSASAFSDVPPPVSSAFEPDEGGVVVQWLERISPSDFSDVSSDRPTAE